MPAKPKPSTATARPSFPGVYINPTVDWGFKRIFGSSQSKEVLLAFLNDLLHYGNPEIADLEIIDPYLPGQTKILKNSAVDVRATLRGGSQVLIEMQMLPVVAFPRRVLLNGAKALVSQVKRGQSYDALNEVTVITIADCSILGSENLSKKPSKSRQHWLYHYRLQNAHTAVPYPEANLNLWFIELPRVDENSLAASDPLKDWLIFLKNAKNWLTIPEQLTRPGVKKALKLAKFDNQTTAEWEDMSKRQLFIEDQKNALLFAKQEGEKHGEKRGEKLGEVKVLRRLVERMKGKGMALNAILELTGLSAAELKALQNRPMPKA